MNAMLFFVMLLSAQANSDAGSYGSMGSVADTSYPTQAPTDAPTEEPTEASTDAPTKAPTKEATDAGSYTDTGSGGSYTDTGSGGSYTDTDEDAGNTDAPTKAPTKPPTEASTDAPKRSKPVHDADAAAEALKAYTVVTDISSVTLTPTKAPTSPALKEGQYLKTETTTVDAVEAKMKIALTAAEAENKAVIQSLEHGVADAIGAKKTNVKVDEINGNKLSRRRLAEVEITFIIIAENAADIAQLQTDIVAAGAEGSIVANIQKHAAANGVLTAELKAMDPTVTIAAPTKTTTTVTVVTVETGTDPNAPTKAPTTDDTMNAASLPALSSMASAICLAMITLLVA